MSVRLVAADQPVGSTRTLLRGDAGAGPVRRTVLPGGLRVITESVSGVRSVAFGIWVGVGSADEVPSLAGASHFLEHLLFKGTRRRTALDISAALDAVGGELNAFTTKEYTCYYARVLDKDLPLAIDVLTDLITSSTIAAEDVEAERGVILEEIAMHDDDPADAVHDEFAALLFGDAPLGRPVLGTVASINALTRGGIAGHFRRRYRPERMVVAVAGSVEHAAVVRLVRAAFVPTGLLDSDARPARPRSELARGRRAARRHQVVPRRTEQANLVLGVPGVGRDDDRRFALGALNAALGGGMSSRLFQEVREKRGLAYSVFSYSTQYAGTGVFGVYAGCLPGKVDQVVSLCAEQLAAVGQQGITAEELARGQGQMRGSLVLGLEDTGSRMSRLGKAELVHGELLGVDELLARIDAVSLDDVRTVAAELLAATPSLAVIGPFEADREFTVG
ncbi:MAG: M16 family metallopeptidase [Actinomycetes bacterium]